MKVLAINGSPHMERSNTSLILDPFLDGMRETGAEVELLYTRKLNIKPCVGCFTCWLKTPGKCVHDDDMQGLYPKIVEADVQVFATPVYVDGMTGTLKNLIDRAVPLAEPFFELRDGHCRHVQRHGMKEGGKAVLVSNCGFWELDNFVPLVTHFQAICRNEGRDYAGALLRPHGPALKYLKDAGAPVDDVFEAAKDAGRQLVKRGEISADTLRTVSRDLLPLEEYFEQVNNYFKQELKKIKK